MLVCVSANHRSAGFALLERLSGISVSSLESLIAESGDVRGGVVLSTCNRFEIYLDLDSAEDFAAFLPQLADHVGMPVAELRDCARILAESEVPHHLFSVTSGLESVALGEEEIAGQVVRSLEDAREASLTTGDLERLFQTAATTSKGVKTKARLSSQGRSLVALALDLAASQIPDWSRANIVLIGTGAYAGASLKALEDRGAGVVSVHSPSGRTHTLGERYRVANLAAANLPEALSSADLVITCTNTSDYVLTYDQVRNARIAPGSSESLLIIDMGMPRNVDPVVAKMPAVDLLDIETVRQHAPLDELGTTELARCIIARAATEFEKQQQEYESAQALTLFRSTVQERVRTEISRVGADDDTAETMRRLGNSLLHPTTMRIKELAREGRGDEVIAALNLLYGDGEARVPRMSSASPQSAPVLPEIDAMASDDPHREVAADVAAGSREMPTAAQCPFLQSTGLVDLAQCDQGCARTPACSASAH